MKSSKGHNKRVNMIRAKDILGIIKILPTAYNDYRQIKSDALFNEPRIKIARKENSISFPKKEKLLSFLDEQNIIYTTVNENEPHNLLRPQDLAYATQDQTLGICFPGGIINNVYEPTIICVNTSRVDNNVQKALKRLFTDQYTDTMIVNGYSMNDLQQLQRQAVFFHELGHALTYINKENPEKEELVAEIFSKKMMDTIYGEEMFHDFYSNNYIKRMCQSLAIRKSEKEAFSDLLSASIIANDAYQEVMNYLN